MSKHERLKDLYENYRTAFKGEEIVLGDGNIDAELLLIGEAPGKDEVRLSKPFVGMAGKNLAEFLEILGVARESIYITNAIKYRLSRINPETGKVVNRPAKKDEIDNNRQYIINEIDIISPKVIITLGNVPLRSVTGTFDISIGTVHGRLMPVQILDGTYQLYPLYHPASIIYNRSLKETYINDIRKLKDMIS